MVFQPVHLAQGSFLPKKSNVVFHIGSHEMAQCCKKLDLILLRGHPWEWGPQKEMKIGSLILGKADVVYELPKISKVN